VIPRFIAALRSGEPPEVHGDGTQSRDFAFVADVVRANILAATAPAEACNGKAYNIAGGKEQSLLEMLAILKEAIGADVEPNHVGPRAGDVRHSFADLSQAKADLGYEPSISFADGLAKTVEWFSTREI
jgi:UDP-glucose 4-epimerase